MAGHCPGSTMSFGWWPHGQRAQPLRPAAALGSQAQCCGFLLCCHWTRGKAVALCPRLEEMGTPWPGPSPALQDKRAESRPCRQQDTPGAHVTAGPSTGAEGPPGPPLNPKASPSLGRGVPRRPAVPMTQGGEKTPRGPNSRGLA